MMEIDPVMFTPIELARYQQVLAEIRPGERVYDLGCGDARGLISCAAELGGDCVGIEIRPEVAEQARARVREAGVEEQVEIRCGDYMEADLSKADAVILYLTRGSLGPLSIKLEEELPVGARVVTHTFDLPGWTAEREEQWFGPDTGAFVDVFLYRQFERSGGVG